MTPAAQNGSTRHLGWSPSSRIARPALKACEYDYMLVLSETFALQLIDQDVQGIIPSLLEALQCSKAESQPRLLANLPQSRLHILPPILHGLLAVPLLHQLMLQPRPKRARSLKPLRLRPFGRAAGAPWPFFQTHLTGALQRRRTRRV